MLTSLIAPQKVSIMRKSKTRRDFSRVHIPADLRDLLEAVARHDGYPPERIHFFLYGLVVECRPKQVRDASELLRLDLDPLEEGLIPPED